MSKHIQNGDNVLTELLKLGDGTNGVTINGDGNVSGVASMKFVTTYTPTGSEVTGQIYWDLAQHTASLVLENGVVLQLGQEGHLYAKNTSNSVTIHNGDAVSITSAGGSFTSVSLTDATNAGSAYAFIGLATQDIAPEGFGYITLYGVVRDINTNSWTEGRALYVDPSDPGHLTMTYPAAPNYVINAGIVEYKHANHGRINVVRLIQPKFQDLSDVNGTALNASGQIAVWNNITKYFDFTENIGNYLKLDLSNAPLTGTSLTWNGNAARDITLNRNTTTDTAGVNLTVQAGGSTSGATNKGGGILALSSGLGTGNDTGSAVYLKTNVPTSSGVNDQTLTNRISVLGTTNTRVVIGNGVTNSNTDNNDGINLIGTIAQNIYQKRHTTTNTAGNNLNIYAGGATSGATDKAGGSLVLKAGISTGTAGSQIAFQTADGATTGAISTITLAHGGAGYAVGDVLTISGGSGTATATVATLTANSNNIATVTLGTPGTTYGIANSVTTTVSPSRSKFGGCVGFLANAAYSATDHADFQQTGNFTVAGWYKSATNQDHGFFQSFSKNTNWAGIFIYVSGANGRVNFYSGRNLGTTFGTHYYSKTGTINVNDNAWHHICCVYDGSYLRLYIDGSEDGAASAWTYGAGYAATNYVRINCYNYTGSNIGGQICLMDDFAVFNSALSSAEITTLQTNELNTQATILAKAVAYYRFEAGALTTDTTAGAHTLSPIGTPFEGPGALINITAITGTADNAVSAKFTIAGPGTWATTSTMRQTASSSGAAFGWSNMIYCPVDSAFGFRTLNFSNAVGADATATFKNTNLIDCIFAENEIRTSGLLSNVSGIDLGVVKLRTSSANVNVTNAYGISVAVATRASGTASGTVNSAIGYISTVASLGVWTINAGVGFLAQDSTSGNTITSLIGFDCAAQTRGATNIGMRIAEPSGGATANYALQLSGTGGAANSGITFGTDTTLYRSAANTLKTDNAFIAGTTVTGTKFQGPEIKTDVTTPTDLTITTGSAKTLVLASPVYKDVFFPQGVPKSTGAGNPSIGTIIGNCRGYTYAVNDTNDFDPQEYPHDGVVGALVHWHIHWVSMTNVAATRGVKWQIEYTFALANGVLGATTTSSVDVTVPANTAVDTHFLTDIVDWTPTNIAPGSMIVVKLTRITSSGTAPAADPFVLGVHFHYSVDTMGSRSETAK